MIGFDDMPGSIHALEFRVLRVSGVVKHCQGLSSYEVSNGDSTFIKRSDVTPERSRLGR